MPPERPKLRKREIGFALAMGVLAAGGGAAVLSAFDDDPDGFIAPPTGAGPDRMEYEVANFEEISTVGPQDVEIAFGDTYSVRAEGAVSSLEVAVENGELVIRPRDGWSFAGLGSTKLYVTLPRLARLTLNGSGDVSVDQVKGDRFVGVIEGFAGDLKISGLDVEEAEFTINGPGDISAAGIARATRVTINGPGEIQAGDLKSQIATITVRGPGDVELAVEQEADISVEGPGEVDIDGPARCSVSTSGPGSVSCGDQGAD